MSNIDERLDSVTGKLDKAIGLKRKDLIERKLDFSMLKDNCVNTFEIRDKNHKLVSTDHERYKIDETKIFYFIGMTESCYFPGAKKPMRCETSGVPSFEIVEYLHKVQKMSMLKLMILYYKLCEDCINELEYFITGREYKRTAITECEYCKPLGKEAKKYRLSQTMVGESTPEDLK